MLKSFKKWFDKLFKKEQVNQTITLTEKQVDECLEIIERIEKKRK